MKKAILGFLALGLPIAAMAANGEREFQHNRLGENAVSFLSDQRANDIDARKIEPAVSLQHHFAAAGAGRSVVAAPEIDPTSALSGLTLLLGGIAVLRGRKARTA
jgi:hypothetical protein